MTTFAELVQYPGRGISTVEESTALGVRFSIAVKSTGVQVIQNS